MLYTGHGDAGYTHVIGGDSLPKSDARLEALGALDEAQAHLGLARALLTGTQWHSSIMRVQADLRLLMGDIATVTSRTAYLTNDHLQALESDLQAWDALTGGFTGFTAPGNTVSGAHLHLARTVIRRAERKIVALFQGGNSVNSLTLTYLNRLSSWVYALCLLVDSPTLTEAVA